MQEKEAQMLKFFLATFSLAFLLSLPVPAGEHGEKCTKPVQDCLNSMVIELKSTGFIGIEYEPTKDGSLKITKVIEGTPAEKAGIKTGDMFVSINGLTFNKENHEAISKFKKPGNEVTCVFKHDGASREIKMVLAPMPADVMAKYIGEHMMQHAANEGVAAKK
jgi:predicted metalloprotease with PDZ domain